MQKATWNKTFNTNSWRATDTPSIVIQAISTTALNDLRKDRSGYSDHDIDSKIHKIIKNDGSNAHKTGAAEADVRLIATKEATRRASAIAWFTWLPAESVMPERTTDTSDEVSVSLPPEARSTKIGANCTTNAVPNNVF